MRAKEKGNGGGMTTENVFRVLSSCVVREILFELTRRAPKDGTVNARIHYRPTYMYYKNKKNVVYTLRSTRVGLATGAVAPSRAGRYPPISSRLITV